MDSTDALAAYQHFLPEARDLPAHLVEPYRGGATSALVNLRIGVANVLEHRDTITRELPDCVDLADILTRHEAAFRGKHAVTPQQVQRAGKVGATLMQTLRPTGGRDERELSKEAQEAADIRDRLWTPLRREYRTLWRVGASLFAEEVEDKVPPLLSRLQEGKPGAGTPV